MSLSNFYSSAGATVIAEFLTLPICTIKTNYQSTNSNSILHTTKDIYNRGGITQFFRASFPAIFGQVMSTSLKYTGFRYLDDNAIITTNKFLNGMIAGLSSTIVTHPLDVWKVYLQTSNFNNFYRDFLRNKLVVYRGYTKTLSKIAVSSSLFFPLYDYSHHIVDNHIVASGISAITSTIIIHPLDYLKTRHMLGKNLYEGLNPLKYYKGISINLMRIVPHFIITMTCIEYLKKYI